MKATPFTEHYQTPLCEWSQCAQADLLCESPGAIEDIELEDWIN